MIASLLSFGAVEGSPASCVLPLGSACIVEFPGSNVGYSGVVTGAPSARASRKQITKAMETDMFGFGLVVFCEVW